MHAVFNALFDMITEDTTVITKTADFAAFIQVNYQQHQFQQGKQAWYRTDILSYAHWIDCLWNDYEKHKISLNVRCLSQTEEAYLWRMIIAKEKKQTCLETVDHLAPLIQQHWETLHHLSIDLNEKSFEKTQDYRNFKGYAAAFKKHCNAQAFITRAELSTFFKTHDITFLKKQALKSVILLQYEDFPNAIQALFTHLRTCFPSIYVRIFDPIQLKQSFASSQCTRYRTSFKDSRTEWHHMAKWAKQQMDCATSSQSNVLPRIACVVPGLCQLETQVKRAFINVFYETPLAFVKENAPFRIVSTLKQPLSLAPSVQVIYLIFELSEVISSRSCPIELMTQLLRSPFIKGAERERWERAQFDRLLRQAGFSDCILIQLLDQNFTLNLWHYCKEFADCCQHFLNALSEMQAIGYASYHAWSQHFIQLLTLMGWPGERLLNEEEARAVQQSIDLLEKDYQCLDQMEVTPVSLKAAKETFLYLLNHQYISHPSLCNFPLISIFDTVDTRLFYFDRVWIAGCDDLSWPPQAMPFALIPHELQVNPINQATAIQQAVERAQQLMQQFKDIPHFHEIILSYAHSSIQGTPLHVSPLILDWPHRDWHFFDSKEHKIIALHDNIETIVEDHGPPYSKEKILCGLQALSSQAICPFKAFAESRLHAHFIPPSCIGLSAKIRGNIIHKSLEIIWKKIKNHAMLIALNATELSALITSSVNESIFTCLSENRIQPTEILKLAVSIEKKRLPSLLTTWLNREKNRPPFQVQYYEVPYQLNIGELCFSIRIDRIDKLGSQEWFMIDYKTSDTLELQHWFGARPDAVQLPAYALIQPKEAKLVSIIGISIALVHPKACRFKGVSKTPLDIDGIKVIDQLNAADENNWDKQMMVWQNTLTQLSDAFKAGEASLNPKNEQACAHCHLHMLCRIHEKNYFQD